MAGIPAAPPPLAPLPPAIPSPLLPPPPPPHWLEEFGDGDIGAGEVVGIIVGVCILVGMCYYERCAPCPGPTRPDTSRLGPGPMHSIAFHPSAPTSSVLPAAQAPLPLLLQDELDQNRGATREGDFTWVHCMALGKSTQ